MNAPCPFHLAFPVRDLAASRAFYVELLGARPGKQADDWLDLWLWGHQLTLHQRPDELLAPEAQGVRHFGLILPWDEWGALGRRLQRQGAPFLRAPQVAFEGTPREEGRLHLADPSGHVIELKSYRDPSAAFGAAGAQDRRSVEG